MVDEGRERARQFLIFLAILSAFATAVAVLFAVRIVMKF